jgi:hypothetical protein
LAAALAKRTYLSAVYHRLAVRRGKKWAILVVAHSSVVNILHMLCWHALYGE